MILIIIQIIRSRTNNSDQYNVIIYKDQLKEIDRDIDRSLLNNEDGEALKAEIQNKIEKTISNNLFPSTNIKKTTIKGPNITSAITIVGIIPFLSIGLYSYLGSPEIPDQPFSKRQLDPPINKPNKQMVLLVKELKKRLYKNPKELKGWILLGRSLVSLKRYQDASNAFKKAFRIAPNRSDLAASAAETAVMAMNGKFNHEIRYFFKAAQKLNPREHKALYYLGLDAFLLKKYSVAIQYWVDLITISPIGAPWIDNVQERLLEAAKASNLRITDFKSRLQSTPEISNASPQTSEPMPTQEDIKNANKMSKEEREVFIRSMVERLAERLKSEPNDLRGWRRLARAYRVLGDIKKAEIVERRLIESEK
jgi:cytochrome c-type biogenesis protein CcmH